MSSPAGWYPDSENLGGLRYWDGSAWTEHRHSSVTEEPVKPDPAATPFPSVAARSDLRGGDDPEAPDAVESEPRIEGPGTQDTIESQRRAGAPDTQESVESAAPDAPSNTYESDPQLLHKKARESLERNLAPDEAVLVIVRGPSAQAVIGTDRRAFVYKKGFMAGATLGSEMTNWTYKHLIGIQIHTGMASGAVVLQAPGQAGTSTSYWQNSNSDPYKAPNAIPITRPYATAQAGVAKLRELIDAAHRLEHLPPAGAQTPSMADEVRKLAELRKEGLITDAEFDEMRRALLGQ